MASLSQYADWILYGLAAAGAALLALTGLFLFVRAITTGLFAKELKHYFYSPIAWLVLAGFAFVNGFVFLFYADVYGGGYPSAPPFATAYFGQNIFLWILLLIVIPAITMRLLAEEKASGTIEPLMTAPVRDAEVVFAKFAAALVFYFVLWLPTLPLIASLYYYGLPQGAWAELMAARAAQGWSLLETARHVLARLNEVMDFGPVLVAYLGLLLLGGAWIAIGLLASSFARNQVVAFMAAFVASIMLFAVGFAENLIRDEAAFFPKAREVLHYVSFLNAFEKFPKGVVDTRALIYFVTLTAVALFFTVRVVESRKWR
jgi:ABC-2 type transport system permease protein